MKDYFVYRTLKGTKQPPHLYTSLDRRGQAIKCAKGLLKAQLYDRVFVTMFEDGKPCGLVWEESATNA